MQTKTVYINFKGGIISSGYLKQVLDVAAEARVTDLRFGLRQQLIMQVDIERFDAFTTACVNKNISFQPEETRLPNLVSSYAGVNIFTAESWLSEGVYKDVFDLFTYAHALKINICDAAQTFTPLFSGHLNWIASPHVHYWYLYIRFPGTDHRFCWPELVYTNDLAIVSQQLEQMMQNIFRQNPLSDHPESAILFQLVKQSIDYISQPVKERLIIPAFHLPYYEGFNKQRDSYWLGIYRRDERYPLAFLQDLCTICLQTKVGQLYATSWKSLVVKGINPCDRQRWDHVLGKHRINVRHAANELNWQIEDRNEDGLILKRHVIRYFDKEDVRTYGLCFAVQMSSSKMFGSVIIRRQQRKYAQQPKSLERFDILYKKDFNPNGRELILFRENVEKDHLGTYLVSLCKFYYEKESAINLVTDVAIEEVATSPHPSTNNASIVYQCSACLSIYDPEYKEHPGRDPIIFDDLPADYQCELCGGNKDAFVKKDSRELYALS